MEISTEIKQNFFPDGCQSCHADPDELTLVTEIEIYGRVYSKDGERQYWKCNRCKDYVGCHTDSITPLGRIADKRLRSFKKRVHGLLDPIWKFYVSEKGMKKSEAKNKAYEWLAGEMDLNRNECHIGYFDESQCIEAIDILNHAYARSASLRAYIRKA